jgi:hypothetical protein
MILLYILCFNSIVLLVEAKKQLSGFLCGKIERKTTPITSSLLSQAVTLSRKS